MLSLRSWTLVGYRPLAATIAASLTVALLPCDSHGAPKPARVSINDVSITEGSSGQVQAIFTISMKGSFKAGTMDYVTADGSATVAGGDYEQTSGTLRFSGGVKKMRLAVSVDGDMLDESNETFNVSLSNPSAGLVVEDGHGVGTIVDDDTAVALPEVSISDEVVGEGNEGTRNATFIVTLSAPTAGQVTVDYATADGTATVAGGDYAAKSGTLTFNEGETSKAVDVSVSGDLVLESDESFDLILSNPANATIPTGSGTGTGTIIDDEVAPAVSINDGAAAVEGDSGSATLGFTVTLSRPDPVGTVTVDYATTTAGTATPDVDYTPRSGTVTFVPGDDSETVSISVTGDIVDEGDETVELQLSNASGAVLAASRALGTIGDDDTSAVAVDTTPVRERNVGTTTASFRVSLSKPNVRDVTVGYRTYDRTAASPDDYAARTDTLTIPAGELETTAEIDVVGERVLERNEKFSLFVTSTTEAVLSDGEAEATIVNDDSKTTKRIRKRRARIRVRGTVAPAHPGVKVVVKLLKRRDGKFRKVAAKRPTLSGSSDGNGDGVAESKYSTRLKRPKRGRCRIVVRFRGDADHGPSKARRTFDC